MEEPQVGRSGAFLFFGLGGGVGKELSGVSVWAVWDCRPLFRRENKSVPFFHFFPNLTNLYSQKHFPTLDYTISFHIGLMMRLRSRPDRIDSSDPTPFDEVFRRMDQADARHDAAVEAEDFQAVGMLLREALISLIGAIRRLSEIPQEVDRPQDANFIAWIELLMNHLCGGGSNKELRQHLKNLSKEAWQLSNWLTHTKSASRTASSIAIHTCQTVVGHMMQILKQEQQDQTDLCPICKSRDVRKHFDIDIPPEGDSYLSCGVCDWHDHPGTNP